MDEQKHSNEQYYMLVYEKSDGWEVLAVEPIEGTRGQKFFVSQVDEETDEIICDEFEKNEIPWDQMELIG